MQIQQITMLFDQLSIQQTLSYHTSSSEKQFKSNLPIEATLKLLKAMCEGFSFKYLHFSWWHVSGDLLGPEK